MTSSMAIGWASVRTQRGVTMTGSRSTSARIISNERLPAPMMIEALSSIVCTPEFRRMRPTSCLLARWSDSSSSLPSPPR